MDTPELPEFVTKDIGPLPVWGWLVALGGGFLISKKLKGGGLFGGKKTAAAAPSSTPAASVDAAYVPGAGGTITSYPNTGASGNTSSMAQLPDSLGNNDDWRAKVSKALQAQGMGALAVDSALTRYLAGEQLNSNEGAIVDRAIALVGFPPNPPTLVPSVIAASKDPTPTATNTTPISGLGRAQYLVKPDDGDIAVFVTDYASIRWVSEGREADTLARSGEVHAAEVLPDVVVPFAIQRSRINGFNKIGSAPQYPADYKGPRTTW